MFNPTNQILFKIGEKGDKFFLILKGKVSVLIAKDLKLEMSEDEYFDYISNLMTNNETYMVNACIYANKLIYPLIREEIAAAIRIKDPEKNFNFEKKIIFTLVQRII